MTSCSTSTRRLISELVAAAAALYLQRLQTVSSSRRKEVKKGRLHEGKKTLMCTHANEFGNVKLA